MMNLKILSVSKNCLQLLQRLEKRIKEIKDSMPHYKELTWMKHKNHQEILLLLVALLPKKPGSELVLDLDMKRLVPNV